MQKIIKFLYKIICQIYIFWKESKGMILSVNFPSKVSSFYNFISFKYGDYYYEPSTILLFNFY